MQRKRTKKAEPASAAEVKKAVPKPKQAAALDLPDQLLARYYRDGELDAVGKVKSEGDIVTVTLKIEGATRTDTWRDLGGGLGFVPSED